MIGLQDHNNAIEFFHLDAQYKPRKFVAVTILFSSSAPFGPCRPIQKAIIVYKMLSPSQRQQIHKMVLVREFYLQFLMIVSCSVSRLI